jgi:uncharacterized protein
MFSLQGLSLQRLLSKGGRFFDLLEAGADEAQQSVRALVELVRAPQDGRIMEKFIASRRQEKHIHEQITALVCSTFITPLEREDIEALSSALSRITKVTKKFAQRLLLSHAQIHTDIFCKQADILNQAADTLCLMVRDLRRGHQLEKAQEQNNLLHQYEGEADKLMLDLLGDLYSGNYSPLQMILIRDLFEMLEKVIDRHRDAGNVVFQIVLKNS